MGFRFWRWDFTGGNNTAIMVDELELIVDGVNVALNKPISADGASHLPVINANDGGAHGTQWQHNYPYPHFILIDTGITPVAPQSYRIRAAGQVAYNPTAWTLYGSNDQSTWYAVHSVSGLSWYAAEWKSFTLSGWQEVSGIVADAAEQPLSRKVRAYNRSTGEFLGETQSNSVTGAYSLFCLTTDEVQVVMLDDPAGTLENDLILRTSPG